MLNGPLLARLAELASRADELEKLLADPDVIGNRALFQKYAQEYGFASRAAEKYREAQELKDRRDEAETILAEEPEGELGTLASQELDELASVEQALEAEVEDLLLTEDADSQRNVIIEIRPGTGGDEAALFAADLFRIYSKYAEGRGWKTEMVSSHPTELGGFREVIFAVKGNDVYSRLRFESGGHRVQRVPATEASGRIHTSAVTVAVLPEAEEIDIEIDQEDLRIDRFSSSGPGGQSVNRTASAIRLTHEPSGMVVSCQDEKSQHKNLAKAMRVLRSRLYEQEVQARKQERDATRRSQIGSGDRSERIRTYNYPQDRVTDHRLGKSYSLTQIVAGDIGKLLADLVEKDKEDRLAALNETAGS